MPYKPGESGNLNGRPRKGKTITDAIKKVLARKHKKTNKTKGEVLAEVLVKMALEENLPAIREIADRVEGKAAQPLEHGGEGGGTVKVEVVVISEVAKALTESILDGEGT